MRKYTLLLLWLLGMLLPLAWLVQFWPAGQRVFDRVFGPLWMHILMHAALFAVLAFVAARILGERQPAPSGWAICLGVLGLVLAAALLQEVIQLSYKARPIVADDLLDLGVDLAGGLLGTAIYTWQKRSALWQP